MSRKPRRPSPKPPTTIKRFPDGHKRKRTPNGVRSTMLAIQYYWYALTQNGREHLTPGDFCTEAKFNEAFQAAFARYPATRGKRPEELSRVLQKLTSGTRNVEFIDLLAFAVYVGLPLPLFLLFTTMVSDELRSSYRGLPFRGDAIQFLRKVRWVVETAEKQVMENRDPQHLFIHIYDEFDEPGHLMAKALTLKTWSDAFNSTEAQNSAEEALRLMQQLDKDRSPPTR